MTEHEQAPADGLSLIDVSLRPAAASFSHVFKQGSIAVVLGGNAAGKTDLCRYIAGLSSTATGGQLWLNGQRLDDKPTRQRSVGYVYQAFVNYPNMTVAQNIASPLRARKKLSPADEKAQVEALAEKLRIADLLARYPHELSGGQQQRLAIARALAREAEVLLLDEPLVNLDFKLREALELELRDLLKDNQTIVIYTSSDQSDAYTLADEVLLLDHGELLQSGSPMTLYRHPTSHRAMRIMADPQINTWRDGNQLCAVRPEHLLILGADEQAELEFELEVQGVETAGSHSLLFGQCRGDTWALTRLGMFEATPGHVLRIGVRKSDVVNFDG